jgi:hypothetical protein
MVTPSEAIFTDNGEDAWVDGQYGSTDKFRNISRSIMYLKTQTDALNTETDPQRCKIFVPTVMDTEKSYGLILNGQNNYTFDNSVNQSYTQLFNTLIGIDTVMTSAFIDLGASPTPIATLKPVYGSTQNVAAEYAGPVRTDNLVPNFGCNAAWEVGWDETKAYWVTSPTYNNPWTANIPSIARCAVVTILPGQGGLVNNISMVIKGNVNAEDDIYLELRNVTGSGMTAKPGTTIYTRITGKAKTFVDTQLLSFPLQHPIRVTAGQQIALVLRSPFTTYTNHYGVGGWGINCGPVYSGGNIYTSYDNCNTWIKHGRASPALPYTEGQREPADWGFIVNTITETTTYTTGQQVWLKPIKSNPVSSVTITPTDSKPTNTSILYEVSPDMLTWYTVNAANSWTSTMGGTHSNVTYVRATLYTTNTAITPSISEIVVNLITTPATVGYLRSAIYYPPTTMPLGLTVWSLLNAPYTADPNTTTSIEVMKSEMNTDYFTTNAAQQTFQLSALPAEPLSYAVFTIGATTATELKETKDYTVNYNTGLVTVLGSALAAGVLKIQYYPLWAKGLTASDFPLRCDYQSQTFTAIAAQTVFNLKFPPCDPLRTITRNGLPIVETTDYSINYATGAITLNVGSTVGDIITVGYTPELTCNGLAINYRVTRSNLNDYVTILPSQYQYRA